MSRGLLDAVYPPICLLCGRLSPGQYPHCCRDCLDSFEPVGPSCCELCGEPFPSRQVPHLCLACIRGRPPFQWCRGLYLYRGGVAEALSQFKYRGQIHLQYPLLEALIKGVGALKPLPDVRVLVPVPMSKRGLWKRGFNQSCILAGLLARQLDLKLLPGAIERRGNRPQVALAAKERSRNASISFAPGREVQKVCGMHVLLFDDVYTTGATARACARVLKKAGAEVSVLTLARAVSLDHLPAYPGNQVSE